MAGAKEHFPRLATVDTVCPAKMSRQLEAALSVSHPASCAGWRRAGQCQRGSSRRPKARHRRAGCWTLRRWAAMRV